MKLEDLFGEFWGDEGEKTASQQAPETEDAVIEKLASQMTDDELLQAEAILEESEQQKLAEDYEILGRFMARGFIDEMNKAAETGNAMVGMTGSAQLKSMDDGKTQTLKDGGDTSPYAKGPADNSPKGQSYETPQDGGKVVASLKAKLDALHQPASPTASEDGNHVLKKIVDAAKKIQKTKQQVAEVPSDI